MRFSLGRVSAWVQGILACVQWEHGEFLSQRIYTPSFTISLAPLL